MKFSVAIYADPTCPSARTALEFVKASLAAGHDIYRLFFFNEGVRNGAVQIQAGEVEPISQSWAHVISQHELDAVVCVNSAQKHGFSTDGKTGAPLEQGFTIGGLAQLIDGVINADRFITFG